MNGKKLKDCLKQGKSVFGGWIQEATFSGFVNVYAQAGFDCVFIGKEHSSLGSETITQMIQLARALDIAPIVRVEDSLYHLLAKPMDWGAAGVMVPRVESAEQARHIANCLKYPPDGERGMSSSTGHRDYFPVMPIIDYAKKANEENLVIVQIETKKGLDNVEQIAGVDGVDVLFVGPLDLSCSLGVGGQMDNPKLTEAIERIIDVANNKNRTIGILCATVEAATKWYDRGARLVTWSNEIRMIGSASTAAVKEFEDHTSQKGKGK